MLLRIWLDEEEGEEDETEDDLEEEDEEDENEDELQLYSARHPSITVKRQKRREKKWANKIKHKKAVKQHEKKPFAKEISVDHSWTVVEGISMTFKMVY
jgi:hypothetical protein